MNIDPRTQKLIKRLIYPLLGLVLFIIFFYATFPYDRLREQLEDHLSASGVAEVEIGELGPRLFFGLQMEDVVLRLIPKPTRRSAGVGADTAPQPPPKPQVLRLARLGVSVGPLSLLAGSLATDFEVSLAGGGEIDGAFSASKAAGFEVSLEGNGLNPADLLAADGPPLAGALTFDVELKVPQGKWAQAEGMLSFRCRGCSYGDGKTLLKVPNNPWLAAGVTVPRVRLGNLGGQLQIAKGAARLQEFGANSEDIKLELQGGINLLDPLAVSRLNLKLRLKIEDALRQKIAVLDLIEGQLRRFKAPDGFYALPITGTLRRPQVAGMGGRS